MMRILYLYRMNQNKSLIIIVSYFKDVFRSEDLVLRPPSVQWSNKYFRFGDGTDSRGLIFSHGPEWVEQRRFALRELRSAL